MHKFLRSALWDSRPFCVPSCMLMLITKPVEGTPQAMLIIPAMGICGVVGCSNRRGCSQYSFF